MDIKTNRKDFEDCIILSRGYCDNIFNFIHYELNNQSDNYYNCGVYGWNYSIFSLNRTFTGLHFNVYIINAYRNSPRRLEGINYSRINKYFDRIIKNYDEKMKSVSSWETHQKIKKQYIKRITKKLNIFLEEDFKKIHF